MIPSDLLIHVLIISSISVVGSLNCKSDDNVIPVCSDDSTTSNSVYLSGVRDREDTTQCSCSLSTGTPNNITITEHRSQNGCQYKFQFIYMSGSRVYSCRNTNVPIISINTEDSIKIKLLPDVLAAAKEFKVCLEIQSEPGSSLTLSCGKSRWSTTSSKPDIETSDTESRTPSGDKSNQPTSKQTTSKQTTTPHSDQLTIASEPKQTAVTSEPSQPASASESNQPATPTSNNANSPTSGDKSNQPTSKQTTTPNFDQLTIASEPNQTAVTSEPNQQTPTSKNDNSLPAIIGGSVGGLVVIIVVIIIVICVLRKRRKDKNCESPEATETDAHTYQNIPDNRSGEITHPYQNIPDNRLGEITHQPKQNNELVHQANDPYTSIDNDIIKPSNGNQGMEYLENDLSNNINSDYVVVDDKLKAQLPVVAENAQVNKSNANKTANGKFKTGPRGDKYTVVNKGGKMINNDKQFKIGPSGDQYVVVKKEGKKKKNKEAGKQFKLGPRGDQYAVVNKKGRSTNN